MCERVEQSGVCLVLSFVRQCFTSVLDESSMKVEIKQVKVP